MPSLLKVDQLGSVSPSGYITFNSMVYNEMEALSVTGSSGVTSRTEWNPEESPVVMMPNTTTTLTVLPSIPSVDGMYMTVLFQAGVIYIMGSTFSSNIYIPDALALDVHRVYYSRNGFWYDT